VCGHKLQSDRLAGENESGDGPDGRAEGSRLLDFQGWSRPGRGLGPYVEASVLALLLAGAAVVCQLTGVLWPLYPAVALCGLILWLRRL
jgi:hypothetical protein